MTAAAPLGMLVKTWPKLSETFILEEVLGLERRGLPLRLYALQPPTDAIHHSAVARVRAPVAYVPPLSARTYLRPHLALLLAAPVAYLRTLVAAARRGRRGLADFARAGWLGARLRADGVAHLHSHFISTPADIAELAARLLAIPFSISAHAKDIYTSRATDLGRKLRAARFTVTCTEANRAALAAIEPRADVRRMYHGIDAGVFHPRRGAADATPLLLAVGRLRAKKGLDTLIDACALLRARGSAFRCEIVGYGEERERLQTQIDRAGLHDHVALLGKLAREQVIDRYAAARVFVQPSRIAADGDRDGIPNVLLEAMAMALPVVATRVCGIPEVVRHEQTGLLVEPDRPQELADAIARLLAHPGEAERFARAARAIVTESFDNDRNLQTLLRLLDDRHECRSRRVAYVMNGFPRLSETFIAHEIHQLERLALPLRLYSVKREDEPAVQPVVAQIRAPLVYLPAATSLSGTSLAAWLARNLPRFARANARVALRHPSRWLRTLGSAAALAWRHRERGSLRLRKVYVKEFLQAGAIAADVLRAGDVDHLHGHFCHGVATITWFASRMTGIPFSFTAHAKDIYQPDLNPGRLLEDKLAAARFVATCTCANAAVLRARHARPAEVHTIYHGLDTEWFSPRPAPAGERPLLLAVGRFVEKKGFDHLVEACARLKDAGVDFTCLIVGERGSAYESIEKLIAAHGLAQHVELRSAVAQDELREIYRRARVFALPCKVTEDGDRDGFPNVLAEAMAMGVPVVSTRISGIPEMIDDGEHGLLVDSGDVGALADALARVLTDDALHARLATAGRQRICERFDSRQTTVALRDLFVAQLLAARHEAAPLLESVRA